MPKIKSKIVIDVGFGRAFLKTGEGSKSDDKNKGRNADPPNLIKLMIEVCMGGFAIYACA